MELWDGGWHGVASLGPTEIVAGEITGWRIWLLRGGMLRSVYVNHYTWPPGKALEAAEMSSRIWGDGSGGLRVPGFHAYKSLPDLHKYYGYRWSRRDTVYGRVALWGDVVEHKLGYRAQFAKPLSIARANRRFFFDSELREALRRYQIERENSR